MNIIDSLVKQYKSKVLASVNTDMLKEAVNDWVSKNVDGIVDSIEHNPEKIGSYVEEFSNLIQNLHAGIVERDAQAPLMSFSSFLEKAGQDYNEGSEKPQDDLPEVVEEKVKSKQEQLVDDIEKAGKEPKEPELIEEDDDESESVMANMKELETAAIKHSNFDWYRFTGARRKKFRYGKSEWTLEPNGIVGISKACDFRNKHSMCILDQSKTHSIDITKHNADLLKKRCKPYTGNVAGITTPTPGTRRVATASTDIVDTLLENDYDVVENGDAFEFTPRSIDKGIAKEEMVKYLSNLFKVEPIESDDEQTHWDVDDGQVILKYQPDFKYVVTTKRK